MIVEVTDEDFEEKVVEKSKEVPVLVDFWARWCAPCLMLSPILERLAEENKGKFILAKVDVEKNRKLAQRYNILAIPSLKLFKKGKIVDELVGIPESRIEESLKSWLRKNLG